MVLIGSTVSIGEWAVNKGTFSWRKISGLFDDSILMNKKKSSKKFSIRLTSGI